MPFSLYLPPGSSSTLRDAGYVKGKKEGEELDAELEGEQGKVEGTASTSSPQSEILSEVQWEGKKKKEKVK